MHKIIVHPGSSHKDDFLSACVLLATLEDAQVLRCEPTEEDLADINTYVVDVGLEYAPERHNFDHHQDHTLPCSFHLIMQHLGYHEAAMQMFAWYPHMSMMDVRGPYRTAEHLGIDSGVLFASSSPIDGYILSTFAELKSLDRQSHLYFLMVALGENLLALIGRKMERLELLKKQAKVIEVNHLKAVYSDIDKSPKLAMELYLRLLDDDKVVMSITPSNRGEGWELLRIGNNTIVDFRAIEDYPEIRFVHSSGFLAKTHLRLPMQEVVRIASLAIADVK